jgi:hypothetical protein
MNRLGHGGTGLVFLEHLIRLHYHLIAFADGLRVLNVVLRVHIQEVIIDGDLISLEIGDCGLVQLQDQDLQVEVQAFNFFLAFGDLVG